MNVYIFSNQILLELIDYLFQFIQIKMTTLKDLKFEDITYQKEDYTTACLLDYAYIKNNYRLIAIDFSRQKELDGKAIQQIECVRQLKNTNDKNASGTQAMSILTVLEKIKETRLRFSQ